MKKALVIGIGVVVTVVVAIAAGGSYYTSKSQTCHDMRTMYVSWQHSTHESVQCMGYDSDSALWGQIVAKVEGAQRLAVHFCRHS